MKKVCLIFLPLLFFGNFNAPLFAQKKLEKEKNKILGEGLALYTLILANWTSNDLYYENEFNTGYVRGYMSYKDKDTLKTIFWREVDTASAAYKAQTFKAVDDTGALATQKPKHPADLRVIVKTFSYKKMNVSQKNVAIGEDEREPTEKEKLLMDFRAMAYKLMGEDTSFFKHYAGVQLKAIPFEAGKEVLVYVYSSTQKEGVIPFGGDYLLVFDKKERTLAKRTDLHHDFMFVPTQYKGKSYDASKSAQHPHGAQASELITPTDVAALLLYKGQLEWDEHHVVGGKYTCVFTLADRKLDIIPTAEFEALKKQKTKTEEEEKKTKMH